MPGIDLAGCLEEHDRIEDQLRDRDAGIRDAFLAAEEVLHHQRLVDPGSECEWSVFTLPTCSLSLPTFASSPPGSEVNVRKPSSISTPSGENDEEEISARVGIDDRLERRLRFVQPERRRRVDRVRAASSEEVPDHRDVRVEDFRHRAGIAVDRQRAGRAALTRRARWNRHGNWRCGCLRRRSRRGRWRRGRLGWGGGRRSRGRRHAHGREFFLERCEPRAVRVAHGLELFPQFVELVAHLLRLRWLCRRLRRRRSLS